MSAQFGVSLLCRNGLPIRISYTGSMSDAHNNPEFEGKISKDIYATVAFFSFEILLTKSTTT